jgi:hypothetical protein
MVLRWKSMRNPSGEFAAIVTGNGADVKFTVVELSTLGVIAHTEPTAHELAIEVLEALKITSCGLLNVRLSPLYIPAVTLAVLKNAESACSWVTSICTGVLPSRETVDDDDEEEAGVRDASVSVIWKNSTETPVGGSSVMLSVTAAELALEAGVDMELFRFELQPASRTHSNAAGAGKSKVFRISGLLTVRLHVRGLGKGLALTAMAEAE